MSRGLFDMMAATIYQPKAPIPDHLLEAARRPMNGRDGELLLARVVDPKEMIYVQTR